MNHRKRFVYASHIRKYCRDISKKTVAPGGGSAAAAVCCMGVSLLQMAIQFSWGRNGARLSAAYKKLEKMKAKLLLAIDSDADVFMSIMNNKHTSRKKYFIKRLNTITFDLGKNCITIVTIAKSIQKYIKKGIKSDFNSTFPFFSLFDEDILYSTEINRFY